MSEFQIMLAGALLIACVAASFRYQYQALFYLMLVVWGGYTGANFTLITVFFIVIIAVSGFLRLGQER